MLTLRLGLLVGLVYSCSTVEYSYPFISNADFRKLSAEGVILRYDMKSRLWDMFLMEVSGDTIAVQVPSYIVMPNSEYHRIPCEPIDSKRNGCRQSFYQKIKPGFKVVKHTGDDFIMIGSYKVWVSVKKWNHSFFESYVAPSDVPLGKNAK